MRSFFLLSVIFTTQILAQEAHMVVEAYSGKVLSAQNASVKKPIASLTKLATAIVAIDWATATETDPATFVLRVPPSAGMIGGANPINLSPGDTLTLRDALYSALLASDNRAAETIAHAVGSQILARRNRAGDPVAAFVAEMNKLAKAIQANNTRFINPHGLDHPSRPSYSTAADVARLSIHAMRRNAINFIVRQKSRTIHVNTPGGRRAHTLRNTHELVGQPGILGIKTGTTNAAGPCLATCMDRDPVVRERADGTKGVTPRRLIVVVLNSPDRFNRTRGLIRAGWAAYDPWLAAGAPIQNRSREILSTPAP